MEKVDIANFMGVLQATVNTENGIEFPGRFMPSGNPVTSPGVTMAQVMSDKGMAQQWHESIRSQYEREEDERNNPTRKTDAPDLVIRGEAPAAGDGAGSPGPATVPPAQAEEELQEAATLEQVLERRIARESNRLEKLDSSIATLEAERREAYDRLVKAEAALEAVLGA